MVLDVGFGGAGSFDKLRMSGVRGRVRALARALGSPFDRLRVSGGWGTFWVCGI